MTTLTASMFCCWNCVPWPCHDLPANLLYVIYFKRFGNWCETWKHNEYHVTYMYTTQIFLTGLKKYSSIAFIWIISLWELHHKTYDLIAETFFFWQVMAWYMTDTIAENPHDKLINKLISDYIPQDMHCNQSLTN